MRSQKRTQMNAPCGFLTWNEAAQDWETVFPNINCKFKCDGCGFAYAEQERRLATGKTRKRKVTHDLTDEDGNVVHSVTNMVETLYFTKEEANA